jgi:hypothetical protein
MATHRGRERRQRGRGRPAGHRSTVGCIRTRYTLGRCEPPPCSGSPVDRRSRRPARGERAATTCWSLESGRAPPTRPRTSRGRATPTPPCRNTSRRARPNAGASSSNEPRSHSQAPIDYRRQMRRTYALRLISTVGPGSRAHSGCRGSSKFWPTIASSSPRGRGMPIRRSAA